MTAFSHTHIRSGARDKLTYIAFPGVPASLSVGLQDFFGDGLVTAAFE